MKWTAVDFKDSVGALPTPEESEFVANTIEHHDPDIVAGPNWISFVLAVKGRVFVPNTQTGRAVFRTICKGNDVTVVNMK